MEVEISHLKSAAFVVNYGIWVLLDVYVYVYVYVYVAPRFLSILSYMSIMFEELRKTILKYVKIHFIFVIYY